MVDGLIRTLRLTSRMLVRHQILLSAGLSAAAGIILRSLVVLPVGNPFFHYVALERPDVYRAFVWSFTIFLFTTPYLLLSMCFSLVYIHFYEEEIERAAGFLPPYPQPELREDMFLIVGERHQQLDPIPAVHPQWLSIPERGLYTGTLAVGAIGSGKTRGLILPAMHQLFGYKANDSAKKLSGIVLEVKGDLCRHLSRILKECGREADYVDVSLESDIRYNPLNNDLDPYAQAFNIASIITSIWGKGKEPFWQQSYTDLVRYVIVLHKVKSGYVTLVDIFRTVISSGQLENLLAETSCHFGETGYIAISKEDYEAYNNQLAKFGFSWNPSCNLHVAKHSEQLENFIREETHISAVVYSPKTARHQTSAAIRERQLLVLGALEVLP